MCRWSKADGQPLLKAPLKKWNFLVEEEEAAWEAISRLGKVSRSDFRGEGILLMKYKI